jgi:hypothetical protein
MPELPWISCPLLRLEYDFRTHAAILYLHEGDCVDMTRAIKLVQNIDKEVRIIRTIAGTEEDTRYSRGARGEWTARLPW